MQTVQEFVHDEAVLQFKISKYKWKDLFLV